MGCVRCCATLEIRLTSRPEIRPALESQVIESGYEEWHCGLNWFALTSRESQTSGPTPDVRLLKNVVPYKKT